MKKYDRILIDASNLMWRSFYAHKHLKARRGLQTGLIYGFIKGLLYYKAKYGKLKSKMVICWEYKSEVRLKIDPMYKVSRRKEATPAQAREFQGFLDQQTKLKELINSMGMLCAFEKGWEADDLLYTLAGRYEEDGYKVAMVTKDHDMFQCLTKKTHMIWPEKNGDKIYTRKLFRKEYGIKASEYLDVLILAGCTTDDVPGIKGIGEATAIKVLKEVKLKAIFEGRIPPKTFSPALQKKLVDVDIKHLNKTRDLVRLYDVLDLKVGRTKARWKFVERKFLQYKFSQFLKQFEKIKKLGVKKR